MEEIKIIYLKTDTIKQNKDDIIKYIGAKFTNKALRFKQENDMLLSLGSSYLKKLYVGDYLLNQYGKPISKNIFFSISHSSQYVGIAINENNSVGLDIEYKNRQFDNDVINYCLSESEVKELDKYDFLSQFVAKESLGKAYGTGLVNKIKEMPSLPINGEVDYQNKKYFRHHLDINDYYFSIVLENEDFNINIEELKIIN